MQPKLETERLTRVVGDEPIVEEVSLSVLESEVLAIIGPSGAGKSSFLRLLNRLDEPTSSLDSETEERIEELLSELISTYELTCVIVTHDVEQARRLGDRIARFEDGRVTEVGAPQTVAP